MDDMRLYILNIFSDTEDIIHRNSSISHLIRCNNVYMSSVCQSNQIDGRVIMKGCVQ